MKIRIQRPNLLLILFGVYNIIYAVYMGGFLSRTIYMISLLIYLLTSVIYIFRKKISLKDLQFWKEAKLILVTALSFLVITLIRQVVYMDFNFFFVERLVYLILPVVIVLCIANSNVRDKRIFIYILVLRMVLQFVLVNYQQLSLQNIFSISWFDSDSSIFESSQAHELFVITAILLCMKRKSLAVITTILCMLNFKRVSFILCIVAWIVIPRLKDASVPKWIVRSCGVAMLVAPFMMLWFYSDKSVLFFRKLGIDLNHITSSRSTLVQFTLNHFNGEYNGYGAIRNYFENYSTWMAHVGSMHCDVLLLYLECGVLGLAVYVIHLLRIAKEDQRIFFVLLYMFMEIVVSQYIEAISAWTIFFLFVALKRENYFKMSKVKIKEVN